MRGRWLAGALALLMLTPAALADAYDGTTVADGAVQVFAEASGTLTALDVEVGSAVSQGDVIASVRTTKVYASQDGTVARVYAAEGDSVSGSVLEVYPVERYQIYCTVSEAYQSAQSTLVHSGEQVYIRCTANGTHRGVGIVTRIDGEEFRVLTIGGELYVGETVYLYRDESFSSDQRIGIGTVVTSDTQTYESDGTVTKMYVSEGEYVQRGELLYEVIDGENASVVAAADGIVQQVEAAQGERVESGQSIASIVPQDQIVVEIRVDEDDVAQFSEGDEVTLVYASDAEELPAKGTVAEVSEIAEDGTYVVKIRPQDSSGLKIGMSVTVRTRED